MRKRFSFPPFGAITAIARPARSAVFMKSDLDQSDLGRNSDNCDRCVMTAAQSCDKANVRETLLPNSRATKVKTASETTRLNIGTIKDDIEAGHTINFRCNNPRLTFLAVNIPYECARSERRFKSTPVFTSDHRHRRPVKF